MRVLMLEAPQALLDERRRRGADRRDEMWDGVLHLQPLLDSAHQDLATKFLLRVAPPAESASLEGRYHPGLFRTDDDYRVPDQAYFRSGWRPNAVWRAPISSSRSASPGTRPTRSSTSTHARI